MLKIILLFGIVFQTGALQAQAVSESESGKPGPTWSASLTAGATNTFQLILGDMFGKGPDFQDRLTASVNNAFLSGDSVTAFGWSTTDAPSATPNWQAGLAYKAPLLRRGRQSLFLTGGAQRWVLPLVGSGAKDWMVTGNLTYGTSLKHIPVFVSEDSYSLLKSTLPTGTALYSQVYTQHTLVNRHGFRLMLKEGPAYSYSWGFYGITGSRVLRYGGSLTATWRGTTIEAGYRKQLGLQTGMPDNPYWSFLITRQITGAFKAFR